MWQSLGWNMSLCLGMRDRSRGVRRDGSGGRKDRGLVWRGCGLWGRGIPGEMGDAKRGEFLLPALRIARLVDETRKQNTVRQREQQSAESGKRRRQKTQGGEHDRVAAIKTPQKPPIPSGPALPGVLAASVSL